MKHTLNYFWKYCFNMFLNFCIMSIMTNHLDPLKGLLYYFKSKWINTVIKKDGNISFKNLSLCNENSTELFLEGSNTAFGGARLFPCLNQILVGKRWYHHWQVSWKYLSEIVNLQKRWENLSYIFFFYCFLFSKLWL